MSRIWAACATSTGPVSCHCLIDGAHLATLSGEIPQLQKILRKGGFTARPHPNLREWQWLGSSPARKKHARYADHVAGHQIRNATCDTPRKKETTLATFSKPQVAGLFFKSFWWRQVPSVPSSAWIFIGFSRWITFHQKMEMKRWRWNHLPNAFHGARERPTDGRNWISHSAPPRASISSTGF